MKRIVLFLTAVFSFLYVQAADISLISGAFKAGNASTLVSSMDQEVDLAVPGSTKKCDANGAVSMLNAFFGSNKPTGFTVVHNADKKESGFVVGKLTTAKGEFRVNITYRADGDKAIIQSIRIE
ncbi:hypothetical protein AGMMS49574_05710 [Bacteroidia bacterium]|nr:hypothetical protein AGMMS49574_05710 [Bacteroidia bacterium]GHV05711.1 hypothetical protein FACS189416_5670 [Bacteroidia bacterium]